MNNKVITSVIELHLGGYVYIAWLIGSNGHTTFNINILRDWLALSVILVCWASACFKLFSCLIRKLTEQMDTENEKKKLIQWYKDEALPSKSST